MGPEALAQVLRPLRGMFPPEDYPSLMRGLEMPDDAAVWKLDDQRALVMTADFFPPLVDDPYDFGAIGAANALSDLFAMGAEPLFGINLVGFPKDLDPGILSEILRGGAEKAREAGAPIVGGHTTTDKEPKYGMAVVGMAHPARLLEKGGAVPGDVLLLTKPLGTGVITTAHKKGEHDAAHLREAVASMTRLNQGAARLLYASAEHVHACTDITGFGLAGHAFEMAEQSSGTLRFEWSTLPLLPGIERYIADGHVTGGAGRNRSFYSARAAISSELAAWQATLLFDPQTSGGLLAAVDGERIETLLSEFARAGEPVWQVGEVVTTGKTPLEVVP